MGNGLGGWGVGGGVGGKLESRWVGITVDIEEWGVFVPVGRIPTAESERIALRTAENDR